MKVASSLLFAFLAYTSAVQAQQSSRNIQVIAHVAVDGGVNALALEQDRPYVWLAKQTGGLIGLDLTNEDAPEKIFEGGEGAVRDLTTFKVGNRYYLAMAMEKSVAQILDVTQPLAPILGLSMERESGFRTLFAYKHSSERALLLAAGSGPIEIFDLSTVPTGTINAVATLNPSSPTGSTDHLFAGYEPTTGQDRLYLAGTGGYFVYDFTNLAAIESSNPLVSIQSAAVQRGRMIAPLPDGQHALTLAEYRTAPVRIFALANTRERTAVGAWMADWKDEYVALQVRWPFAFVAALEGGLYVVNVFDPGAPYTDAFFRTTAVTDDAPLERGQHGISRVDVRNDDGLIVISDLDSGFWTLRVEGFSGWHGHQWGLPNVSNVQDWDNGPDRQ